MAGADDQATTLRADYAETVAVWRQLVDVRFKLLALVPTLSGIGVAVIGSAEPSYATVVVAVVAILSIVAIAMYDLRNTLFHDTAVHRAKTLEARLGLKRASADLPKATATVSDPGSVLGGWFADRPRGRLKLFGLQVWHDRALWIVYSASIGGWAAVGGFALASRLDWHPQWGYGAGGGLAIGLAMFSGLRMYDMQWDRCKDAGLLPEGGPTGPRQPAPDSAT